MNSQACIAKPPLSNLNPGKHNQVLSNYSLIVSLDRCKESCNNLDDPSDRICALNET